MNYQGITISGEKIPVTYTLKNSQACIFANYTGTLRKAMKHFRNNFCGEFIISGDNGYSKKIYL